MQSKIFYSSVLFLFSGVLCLGAQAGPFARGATLKPRAATYSNRTFPVRIGDCMAVAQQNALACSSNPAPGMMVAYGAYCNVEFFPASANAYVLGVTAPIRAIRYPENQSPLLSLPAMPASSQEMQVCTVTVIPNGYQIHFWENKMGPNTGCPSPLSQAELQTLFSNCINSIPYDSATRREISVNVVSTGPALRFPEPVSAPVEISAPGPVSPGRAPTPTPTPRPGG